MSQNQEAKLLTEQELSFNQSIKTSDKNKHNQVHSSF